MKFQLLAFGNHVVEIQRLIEILVILIMPIENIDSICELNWTEM